MTGHEQRWYEASVAARARANTTLERLCGGTWFERYYSRAAVILPHYVNAVVHRIDILTRVVQDAEQAFKDAMAAVVEARLIFGERTFDAPITDA